MVEFTRKHTGKVGEALGDIRRIVEQLVAKRDERRDGFVAVIRKAMEQKLGEDAEEAMKALTKAGIARGLAKQALELAEKKGRFTIFSLVDALTRLAGECEFAGERTDADQKASALLAPRGLTTISWWLPSGREVSGTEHFSGRLAGEPSDPANRSRGLVRWLWFLRKVRPTHSHHLISQASISAVRRARGRPGVRAKSAGAITRLRFVASKGEQK